jgi:glyoxylase-like metal-dependent hydrolase (beta-lactamase superfamily II)
MFNGDQTRLAMRPLLLLASAALASVTVFSQGGPARAANPPDISGEWRLENSEDDTTAQPPLGDYTGIPFNDAGRMRSDTTAESIWGTPEYQCRPHSAPHQWRGLGGARILKEQDPLTRDTRAYHVQFMRSLDRPIFMDGRPHPPAWAPHSWTGFSTGEWIGNTLKVTTTHLKDGYLKRGGPQTSDMYSMTEFITRHADILSIVTVIDDPIYMDEPYVHSTTYAYDPTASVAHEVCNSSAFAENGGSDRHWVPHFLPGENNARSEWLKNEDWFPPAAALGGVRTLYPEYRTTLNGGVRLDTLKVPASRSALTIDKRIAEQSPRDGQVHVLPVQGNIYMLVTDGANVTVSLGPEGVMVVNTGSSQMSDKLLTAINQLANAAVTPPTTNNCVGVSCPGAWGWSSPYMNAVISSPAPPKPVRYIVNTSVSPDNVGGNLKIATSGFFPRVQGFGAAVESVGRGASIVAHENVLNRMTAASTAKPGASPGAQAKQPAVPAAAQPTDTYFDELFKLPAYVNGEAVIVYYAPAANTDGDSFVFFRHSEVIAAGDLYSTVSYPLIDVEKGGTIQGVIDGLNKIIDLAVPEYRAQGGTWIIPGRGRLSDTADVASYRNMVTMMRDRIRELKSKGMTLQQVKAAHPTLDFDGRYGATTGPWTTDMFVEAVYRTLQEKK